MQPPLSQGSNLRDRYIVKHVIGQGGMGRTYMALDTERFNEACVLKEFIPIDRAPDVIAKAKELFQREASILYQIRHPQVPEFRANFEAGGRLFLVQDYVEGQTLRQLFIERRDRGIAFTEAEVTKLMHQILPILSYLHERGIIHRDISPENLIVRSHDRLPVLIDFGVVKEAASKLNSRLGLPHATMAGKLGYAPPEQMQTGQAYASSDLYALAVTAIVLLTGREPQELFDDTSLSWQWQQFATVSAGFAGVLNRMLSYKPGARFNSAEEVVKALQTAQASMSEVKTFAVGRSPTPDLVAGIPQNTVYAKNNATHQALPPRHKRGNGLNIIWGILLVLISGLGSWAIASMLFDRRPSANVTSSPTPTDAATKTPVSQSTPTPTKTVINVNKNLDFAPNSDRVAVSDKISADRTVTYRFNGQKGQIATASLTGSGLLMSLNFQDQKPIDSRASNVALGYWQGKLPATGAYFITIKTEAVSTESNYNLEVRLEGTQPSPTPIETSPTANPTETPPTTSPTPTETSPNPHSELPKTASRNIDFPPGSLRTSVEGVARPNRAKSYNVSVLEGQTLVIKPTEGNVKVEVLDPNGNFISSVSDGSPQQLNNTVAGTYQVRVTSDTESAFRLEFNLR